MSWQKKLLTFLAILIIFGSITLIVLFSLNFIDNWGWILLSILWLYFINITFIIYIFYAKNRPDKEKKCWIFIQVILPIFGPILFLKYGYYAYHKNSINQVEKTKKEINKILHIRKTKINKKNNHFNEMSKYSTKMNASFACDANITKINDLQDLFQLSLDLIDSAQEIIFVNFYIIADSQWLKALVNKLVEKAKQGIKVYFIYDPFGSKKRFSKRLLSELKNNGVYVSKFRPRKSFVVTSIDNNRSHKKALIIDNKQVLCGGFNISDEYLNANPTYHYWMDEAYLIKGEAVKEYIKSYATDWMVYGDNKIDLLLDLKNTKFSDNKNKIKTTSKLQIYDGNPETNLTKTENFWLLAFAKAKKRIWINTPYLYLSEQQINLLSVLSKSGVDIRIVMPGLCDNKKFITYINQLQYKQLIENGIKIYEVGAFNHKKSIIIDDIVYLGTCNLDQRAMYLNYEYVSFVEDRKLLNQLISEYKSIIETGNEIPIDFKKDISLKNKILVKLLMITETLL